MPIFRYTFKKILISPSTWVIFVLTLAVLGLSWGLPIGVLTSNGEKIAWTKDLVLTMFLPVWKILSFTVLIGLMLLIFIGVKATQIFRDEIDDGTLLILVSKPISRNRIWAEKWLSFQVTVVGFLFFSILFGGLLLVIPGIGGPVVFLTLLPYLAILFGIGLLFDLIFTSIVLLISLVLNSKATIAITIGFAALINIFSQAIDPLVNIPSTYYEVSHAVAVYHDVEKKIDNKDFTWFNEQVTNNTDYRSSIREIMTKVYKEKISDLNYPDQYDAAKEKIAVREIIATGPSGNFTQPEVDLLTHIDHISSIFRIWADQSYEELMTSQHVGDNISGGGWSYNPRNYVDYSAYNVVKGFNLPVTENNIKEFNTKIRQKRVMRYFNVFYQLYYLWGGAWGDNASLYISNSQYSSQEDPYLISFNEKEDGTYQVDANSGKAKIINFPALITVYLIIGVGLLGTSWYVFNRRDFA